MVLIPDRRTLKTIPAFEDLNMVIYGIQKVGKTSFVSGDLDSVTLACEPGSDFLAARPVTCTKYDDFLDVLDQVKKDPKDYSALIVDTVDCLYQLCEAHVCAQLKINDLGQAAYGKGWNEVRKTWEGWLDYAHRFTRFRFISHMEERETETQNAHGMLEKYVQKVQRFNGKKARWLDATCHLIGYMYSSKDGQRVITFSQNALTAAGDRTGILSGAGNIVLPQDKEKGFSFIANLYKERAEKLGYTLTYRRQK